MQKRPYTKNGWAKKSNVSERSVKCIIGFLNLATEETARGLNAIAGQCRVFKLWTLCRGGREQRAGIRCGTNSTPGADQAARRVQVMGGAELSSWSQLWLQGAGGCCYSAPAPNTHLSTSRMRTEHRAEPGRKGRAGGSESVPCKPWEWSSRDGPRRPEHSQGLREREHQTCSESALRKHIQEWHRVIRGHSIDNKWITRRVRCSRSVRTRSWAGPSRVSWSRQRRAGSSSCRGRTWKTSPGAVIATSCRTPLLQVKLFSIGLEN